MKNAAGRDIPEEILQATDKDVFRDSHAMDGKEFRRDGARVKPVINSEGPKLLPSIKNAFLKCEIKNGMTLNFHHHFREGGKVLDMVMEEAHKLGIKNTTTCVSSMGNQNNPIIYMIDDGTITNIQSLGVRGEIGKAISEGRLQGLAIMRSHGGRVRTIESGETHIDIALIGTPTADEYGSLNASGDKANCGVLSYSAPDTLYADKVVAIADCLVPPPNWPHQISQIHVDYAVVVGEIGDPPKIITDATKSTSDQRKFPVASYCTEVVKRTPYLKDDFSYQTGVGGASITGTISLADVTRERNIHMSFGVGDITKPMCQLLEEGLARTLMDTQDFDEYAIQSAATNPDYHYITAGGYADSFSKGTYVNKLDFVILATLEVDVHFNCNVVVGSNGVVSDAQGGYPDTAASAKCTIVVTPILQGRTLSTYTDMTTVTTPGGGADVVTTDYGIAINPKQQGLIDALKDSGFPLESIEELRDIAYAMTGEPEHVQFGEHVAGIIEARDGSIMDVVREIKPFQSVD